MTAPQGIRFTLVTALVLVLCAIGIVPAPPVSAATAITLEGNGYGHGIGMSQYGARYRAEAGHTYAQILAAYYPGTTLATGSDTDRIHVRVESDTDNVTSVHAEPGRTRLRTGDGIVMLPSTVAGGTPSQWRLRIVSNALVAEALVGSTWQPSGSSAVTQLLAGERQADFTSTDGSVRLVLGSVHREYLGAVRAVRPPDTSTTLRTVVVSRMSNYLASVVAAEMPSSWHAGALQAQAVAARTYARFDAESKPSASYYDTCDTTSCQVFSGRAEYSSNGSLIRTWAVATTTAATRDTAGRYLSHQGGPAFTQFSASNGGYSVAGSRPYLQAAPDSYDRYPVWRVTLSATSIERAYPAIGRFSGISVSRDGRGPYGGRATSVRIIGSSGSVTVTGNQFRSAFGLRSTLFGSGQGPAMADITGDRQPDAIGIGASGTAYLLHGAGAAGVDGRTTLLGSSQTRTPVAVTQGLSGTSSELLAVDSETGDLYIYPAEADGLGSAVRLSSNEWRKYDTFMGVMGFGGNGRPGFLARGTGTGTLYYFESDGAGGLRPRQVVSGWGASAEIVAATAAGDWNGDSWPDVIVLGRSGTLWLYPGTGNGTFGRRVALSSHPGWSARTSLLGGGDWDGDGRVDLISTTAGGLLMINSASSSGGVLSGRELETGWRYRLLS